MIEIWSNESETAFAIKLVGDKGFKSATKKNERNTKIVDSSHSPVYARI
jgi:hypothetical protein